MSTPPPCEQASESSSKDCHHLSHKSIGAFHTSVSTNTGANNRKSSVLPPSDDEPVEACVRRFELGSSPIDQNVVDEILSQLNGRFGKEQPLTFTKGMVHDNVGMKADYYRISRERCESK